MCALFCRNYGTEGFWKITYFWRWQPISVGAFSLTTDGSEEIFSRLIHMAKLQDPTIILVFSYFIISSYIFFFSQNFTSKPFIFSLYDEKGFDLINGVSELKRDVIIGSTLTRYSYWKRKRREVKAIGDGDEKKRESYKPK